MAAVPVTITGVMWRSDLEVGGGPSPPGPGGEPPGIWGGMPWPTPPIYIPVPPPDGSGLSPEHPIYIPVYPAHPIVIPTPPVAGHPEHPIVYPPIVWPPLPPRPPSGIWPPGSGIDMPAHPIAPGGRPGLWPPGSGIDMPEHPIYIPIMPPSDAHPEHPIYFPVYPSHPIVLPPDGEKPQPPPAMVNPPTGQPGFWGYSVFYDSFVFVPYAGVPGVPTVPQAAPGGSEGGPGRRG